MKRTMKMMLCCLVLTLCAQAQSIGSAGRVSGALEERFLNPPDAAKPWVYWFWMNGNVTKEGITADLEAMNRIGIGGALMMGVGLNTPPGEADFNSPLWRDLYRHAADESVRLGMQLTLHQCDGWATAGGPWITPDRSIKMLVWTTQEIDGPVSGSITLEQPLTKENFYEEVALLAVPLGAKVEPVVATATVDGNPAPVLVDGNYGKGQKIGQKTELRFDAPHTVRTLVFQLPKFRQGLGPNIPATIEVSVDGKSFRQVATFDLGVNLDGQDQRTLTVSFPSAEARVIRVVVNNPSSSEVGEIEVLAEPRVDQWEVKSSVARRRHHGGETRWIDTAPAWPGIAGIAPDRIVDLSGKLSDDGLLDWQAPAGRWLIIRAGMTSTAKHVAPRTHAGEGLEADKMSGEAIRFHFDSFAKGMIDSNNVASGNPIYSVHTDSWESGLHTSSSNFRAEFEKRRGYSMTKWLPVMTSGLVVGSAGESDRFLWDVRRTMADLIRDNFYGEMRRMCHENGVLFQSEAAGRQMFMYDPINYNAMTDISVGEFWMPGNVREDCRVAASVAHIYGRPIAAAESFTAGSGRFCDDPFALKALGDRAFCTGINRYIIHRYCMQPFNNVEPGMTFGSFGINFERTQTWWKNGGKAWCEYVTRCQSLLQSGTFVADVIHYIGHDAPNVLGHRHQLWNPVPAGYDFDGCNLEILKQLRVEPGGVLVLPSGMRYRVLLLPNRERMTIEAAREVERLVNAGATVVGPRPVRTPGLKDWQAKDAELADITARCWGKISNAALSEVLGGLLPADFDYDAPDHIELNYIHRRTGDADFYFVANANQGNEADAVLRFRITGKQPELWDAATGETRTVDAWREAEGVSEFPVHFDPAGSWFVVFRNDATAPGWNDPSEFSKEPTIETNTLDHFTMALWLKSSAGLALPPPGTGGVKPAAQNCAVYPVPGHEIWGGTDAGLGLSAGKDGLMVIGHSARYFVPLFIHAADLSEWTHVAVVAEAGNLTLYVNGAVAGAAPAPGRPLHASIGVKHHRGSRPFDGATSAFFQTSEILDAKSIGSLMDKTVPEEAAEGIKLAGPWTLSFPPNRQAPAQIELPELISWTEHPDDGVKYFSGTATYRTEFEYSKLPASGSTLLDLGEVKNVAEVNLNGKDLGVLWKPPFRLNVTDVLRHGRNVLEVKVTNLWPNRLIGDAKRHPDPWLNYSARHPAWAAAGPLDSIPDWVRSGGSSPVGRTTWLLWGFYGGDEPLLPSGLLGPVRLVEE